MHGMLGVAGGGRRRSAPRFAGDPGAGNTMWGFASETQANSEFTSLASLTAPYGVARLYVSGWLTSWTNSSTVDFHHNAGRIPHISFKDGGRDLDDIAAGNYNADVDAFAQWIDSLSPAPVWWTFWHEPEGPTDSPALNQSGYRAAQRYLVDRINNHNGVTNAAFVFGCLTAGIWGGLDTRHDDARRDWRRYYPDWKGTTTDDSGTGGPDGSDEDPNPVDYYLDGDPDSVVDAFGLDCYVQWYLSHGWPPSNNQWEDGKYSRLWSGAATGTPPGGYAAQIGFLGKPFVIGEFGCNTAQYDSVDTLPHGDTNYTNYVASHRDLGHITYLDAETEAMMQDIYDTALAEDIIALEWWHVNIGDIDIDVRLRDTPGASTMPSDPNGTKKAKMAQLMGLPTTVLPSW